LDRGLAEDEADLLDVLAQRSSQIAHFLFVVVFLRQKIVASRRLELGHMTPPAGSTSAVSPTRQARPKKTLEAEDRARALVISRCYGDPPGQKPHSQKTKSKMGNRFSNRFIMGSHLRHYIPETPQAGAKAAYRFPSPQ